MKKNVQRTGLVQRYSLSSCVLGQGNGCLEIPIPRPYSMWELSAMGIPFVL
jgi:hypothetical protein